MAWVLQISTGFWFHLFTLQLSVIQDKVEMLKQLKTLEREDRTHRQKMLGAMPVSAYALCILGISVNHETVVQKVVVAIMLTF